MIHGPRSWQVKSMTRKNNYSTFIIAALFGLLALVWGNILFARPNSYPTFYFLDVGQGDSELVVFPDNVKIMTDAGPDQKVIKSLERAIGGNTYIDLAIVSHPQLDHFNGFNYLLDKYTFGAFIINGRDDTKTVEEWPALLKKIKERNIPLITLGEGDSILHQSSSISMLAPNASYIESGELNDTGLVELIKTGQARAIFTADIGANIEEYISKKFNASADILKVSHHGSKYSSSDIFLKAVNPKVTIIEVGKNNRYGHPTKEALERLENATKNVFRTDQNGTVKIVAQEKKLLVFTEK